MVRFCLWFGYLISGGGGGSLRTFPSIVRDMGHSELLLLVIWIILVVSSHRDGIEFGKGGGRVSYSSREDWGSVGFKSKLSVRITRVDILSCLHLDTVKLVSTCLSEDDTPNPFRRCHVFVGMYEGLERNIDKIYYILCCFCREKSLILGNFPFQWKV